MAKTSSRVSAFAHAGIMAVDLDALGPAVAAGRRVGVRGEGDGARCNQHLEPKSKKSDVESLLASLLASMAVVVVVELLPPSLSRAVSVTVYVPGAA